MKKAKEVMTKASIESCHYVFYFWSKRDKEKVTHNLTQLIEFFDCAISKKYSAKFLTGNPFKHDITFSFLVVGTEDNIAKAKKAIQ